MFKQWCVSRGYANSTNLSHVLMDGGVLSIPYDRLTDFYKVYVNSVKNDEKIFVVEQKTEVYNFFVDLDYKDAKALSLERIESIVRVIGEKVNSLGGGDCLISVSKPKPHGELIKSGIHLNWPNFPVDQKNALNLRQHIVSTLTTIYKGTSWEDVVDNSVYGNLEKGTKGSGFRMPWSHKKGKHLACAGAGCTACDNSGKLTEVSYLPVFMYKCEGPFKLMEKIDHTEPSVEVLMAATIRTPEGTATRVVQEPENSAPPKTKKKASEGKFTREQTRNEYTNPEALDLLETFIKNNLDGQSSSKITKMFKGKDGAIFISTDSSYCENLGRKHTSNHVWFLINEEKTICQRCFCNCDTMAGRKRGMCKDFTGKKHTLSQSILKLLFPIKKSDKIKSAIRPS